MDTNGRNLELADDFVADYDQSARRYGWFSPDVLFGLMHEYLAPNDVVLDLGIGTGLSATPFHRAGLSVCGIDGSRKMLEKCSSKGIATALIQHDLRSTPFPFADRAFNHVIACGVFHLLGRVEAVFAEASRLIRGEGAFAFTVESLEEDAPSDGTLVYDGLLEFRNQHSGVLSFMHSHELIDSLCNSCALEVTKMLDYVAYRKTEWADERTFRAYIARRKPGSP